MLSFLYPKHVFRDADDLRYFFLEFSQGASRVKVQLLVSFLSFFWVVEPNAASEALILELFAPLYLDRLSPFLNVEVEVVEESEIYEFFIFVIFKEE